MWKILIDARDSVTGPKNYNVLVSGVSGAGKKSIIQRIKDCEQQQSDDFVKYKFANLHFIDESVLKSIFPPEIHGMIFVVDSSRRQLNEEAKLALDTLMDNPLLKETKIIVFNNKTDVEYVSAAMIIMELGLLNRCPFVAEKKLWYVVCCSAKEKKAVNEGIERLYQAMSGRDNLMTTRIPYE